jgi:hypothetical protein
VPKLVSDEIVKLDDGQGTTSTGLLRRIRVQDQSA